MRHLLLFLVSLSLSTCQSSETAKVPPLTKEPFTILSDLVDQYAQEALDRGNMNAISLAIYRDGVIYHQHYGELERGGGVRPDDQTLYEIASISKVFLGSLVARAVLNEKIGLEEDIRKYLPGDYPNLSFAGTPVTVKNLVTHTLGFATPPKLDEALTKAFRGEYLDKGPDYDLEDFLAELKTVQLTTEPGTVYDYNNVGSEIAAYILEQVYQRPYQELLTDFLHELGMHDTHFMDFAQYQNRLATGYDEENQPAAPVRLPLIGASGGLIATVPDLTRLLKFQLANDDPLVAEATRTLFEDEEGNVVGYLWEDMGVAKEEGFYYLKTGDANGTRSGVLLCPDSDYGLLVITNNQTEAANEDWLTLFYAIETDLIKYPKLNLKSLVKPEFLTDPVAGKTTFNQLKTQTDTYFNTDLISTLNRIGYELLYDAKKPQEAIAMFQFALEEEPINADLHDSLGEAYFLAEEYDKALASYQKSLALDPTNENAEEYIQKIKAMEIAEG